MPVISQDMDIPLVRSIDLQLAGRYENYSDFGSVAKPKVAIAWDVVNGVRLRGSYQQGFKAPNLETTAPFTFARAQAGCPDFACFFSVSRVQQRDMRVPRRTDVDAGT